MKVYFSVTKPQEKEYNVRLLQQLCVHHKVEIVDRADKADCVWVSLCDVNDLPVLIQARKHKRPIVAGGFIAHLPIVRLWADYVCLGEAYDFVRQFSKAKRMEELADFDCVSCGSKIGTINENIEYHLNPIVQVTNRSYYYYCGKGCPQRCQYCVLSWSRKYQQAPQVLIEQAIRKIPKSGKLMPMVSYWDYTLREPERAKLGILDVKITSYLREGGKQNGRQIRTGVEFATPELRRKIAKPLSQEAINEFIYMTGENKHEVIVYYIAGLEDEGTWMEFFDRLPRQGSLYPRIIFVFTYFCPQQMTPMADYDLRQRFAIDGKRLFRFAGAINRRIRAHQMKYMAYSTWRCLIERANTPDEVNFAWSMRNKKDNEKMIDSVLRKFPHMVGSASLQDVLARSRGDKSLAAGSDSLPSGEVESGLSATPALGTCK